jgi:hypothetical protein
MVQGAGGVNACLSWHASWGSHLTQLVNDETTQTSHSVETHLHIYIRPGLPALRLWRVRVPGV